MADRPSGATDFASGTSLVAVPSDSQIQSGLPATQPSVNLFNGIFRRLFRWVDFLGEREHPRYGGLNIDWESDRPRVKLPWPFTSARQEDKPAEIEVFYITSASRQPISSRRELSFVPSMNAAGGTLFAPASAASIAGAAYRLARLEYVAVAPAAAANTVTLDPAFLQRGSDPSLGLRSWRPYFRQGTANPILAAAGITGLSASNASHLGERITPAAYLDIAGHNRSFRAIEYKGVVYGSLDGPYGFSNPQYFLPASLAASLMRDTSWPRLRFQKSDGTWVPADTTSAARNRLELTFDGTISQTTFDTVLLIDGQGGQIRSFARSDATYDASAKKFTWTGDFPNPAAVRQIAFLKLGSAVQADVLQRIAASNYNIQRLANKDFLTFRDSYTLPANKLFIKRA